MKIKHCPFCGKKAELKSFLDHGDEMFVIECSYCGASQFPDRTEKEAIKKWNIRIEL